MKVAITSTGATPDSAVDPRFGRAQYFLIYDTDSDQVEAMNNLENMNASHGAGIQSAENVAGKGAQYVLSGQFGPKAENALQAAGIQMISGVKGTVAEAYEKFKTDTL